MLVVLKAGKFMAHVAEVRRAHTVHLIVLWSKNAEFFVVLEHFGRLDLLVEKVWLVQGSGTFKWFNLRHQDRACFGRGFEAWGL